MPFEIKYIFTLLASPVPATVLLTKKVSGVAPYFSSNADATPGAIVSVI